MSTDGPDDTRSPSDGAFRVATTFALLLGAGSGGYNLFTAPDRYSAADAAVQAERLGGIQAEINRLRDDVRRIDRHGPIIGNRQLAEAIKEHEKRLDSLERE